MSRRTTGVMLLFVAAMLYSTRYLAAAIFGPSLQGRWNADLFSAMLQYVGRDLVTWSLVALVAGLVYLIWAEVEAIRIYNKSSGEDQERN